MDNSTSEIKQTETILSNTGEQQPAQPRKNRTWLYCTIALLVVLIAGGAAYAVFQNDDKAEVMAYNVLENNDDPQDYKDFLEKYPESKWAAEVKERLEKLEQMIRAWNGIALSDDAGDFIKFKSTYDSPHYTHLCDLKIDSLDFVTAQRIGTPESFQDYLAAHPDGRYASEASIAQGDLKNLEVDADEQEAVVKVITEFFEGFGAQDETLVCSNITATMKTFLHHKDVTKSEVVSAIKGMFNEHIQECDFVVNRDINITRPGGGNAGYTATFTVDQHIKRDNEGKTFGSYKCQAELTPQLLINAITLDEISAQ